MGRSKIKDCLLCSIERWGGVAMCHGQKRYINRIENQIKTHKHQIGMLSLEQRRGRVKLFKTNSGE